MNITKNFTYEEFTKSSVADARKIENLPNAEEREYIETLAETVLQPIRDEYKKPIVISSGFRCKKLNKAVGGASNSDHIWGCAVDIHSKSDTVKDNKELFDLIVKMAKDGKIHCRQIIDEYGYNWVHVSINNKHNNFKNNQVLHIK